MSMGMASQVGLFPPKYSLVFENWTTSVEGVRRHETNSAQDRIAVSSHLPPPPIQKRFVPGTHQA